MTTVLYGASQPGIPEMLPAIARCYTLAQVSSVPNGTPIVLSATSAMVDGAGTYPGGPWGRADLRGDNGVPAQNNAIAFLVTYFTLSQVTSQDQGIHTHEPDNNGGSYTAAQYNAELIIVQTRVKPAVNAAGNRASAPMSFGSCMTGNLFLQSTATLDTWMGGTGIDFVGSDPYQNLALIAKSAAYAAHLGVPWFIHEFGTEAAGQGNSTDAQHLSHMQSFVSINNGLANPTLGCMWFDSGQNIMDCKANAATSVGATSIGVTKLPGNSSSSSTFPSGSMVTIDPHGAHPETVTTTTTLTYTGTGANTLHFTPALSFAHANNAVVWLYPQAIAYWRTPPPSPGGGGAFTQSLATTVTTAGIRKATAVKATLLGHAPNSPAYITAESSTFEGGSVGAWYVIGSPAPVIANTTAQAKAGIRSMQVTWPTHAGSGQGVTETQIDFAAAAGDVINATVWVFVTAGVSPVQLGLVGTSVVSRPSTLTGQWQLLTLTFTAAGGVQSIAVFPTGSTTSGQVSYVDEAYLYRSAVRDLGQRITAARALLTNPVESARAAAGHVRLVAEPVLARALTGRFLQVAVVQAPARRLGAALTSTQPIVEAAAVSLARATAATTRATKTVAASIASLIVTQSKVTAVETAAARTVAKVTAAQRAVEAPARVLQRAVGHRPRALEVTAGQVFRNAVTATRTAVPSIALSLTETLVALGLSVATTVTSTPVLTQAVTSTRRAATVTAASVRRQTGHTVGAFLAMFNRLAPGIASSSSTSQIAMSFGTASVVSPGIDGPYSFLATSTGGGDGLRLVAPTNTSVPPALAGERWYSAALVQNTSGAAQQVNLYVEFLTSGLAYISSHLVGFAVIKAGQTALIAGPASTVAPPTAAFAHLLVYSPNAPIGYTQLVDDLVLVGPNAGLSAAVTATGRLPVAPVLRIGAAIVSSALPAAITHPVARLAQTIAHRLLAAVIRGVPSLVQSQGPGNPTPPNFDARA